MHWPKLSTEEIKRRVFGALSKNLNYRTEKILGIPATFLDDEVFYEDAPFLKDAPFLSALIANPNHIGCHTLESPGEAIFAGTQEIERDLIRICSEEIFGAEKDGCDGYVASGGTEANIEAVWIYRNYFIKEKKSAASEICLLFSDDSHYSFHKAADLLGLQTAVFRVNAESRAVDLDNFSYKVQNKMNTGVKYFILVANMGTTMFGSVDDIDALTGVLDEKGCDYRVHVDAAFGGFIYPFTCKNFRHGFGNSKVSSVTVDGHKLLQTPYGTGIFLVRKNMMQYVCTKEASYVQGNDYTLCGSRSGANAISVWMILHKHGSAGWSVKMEKLLDATTSLCAALKRNGIDFYRHQCFNIVTIKAKHIPIKLAEKYFLVPDSHEHPQWYKIVMMPHVRPGVIDAFLADLTALETTVTKKK